MRREDLPQLAEALKSMMSNLPEDERAKLERDAEAAHRYMLDLRSGPPAEALPEPPRELFFVYSLLHDDPDGLLETAYTSEEFSLTWVDSDGGVHWGGVDYDNTDPGWARCVLAWYETEHLQPQFPTQPTVREIESCTTLAILGDWGGNNAAAQEVARTVQSLAPEYYLHLGDVYYVGTDQHGPIERDYQRKNFLDVWPGPDDRSFNLNSNHDMYAHASGYFRTALASPAFRAQGGCSYFALYNEGFRFVGLDTAFFDPDRSGYGFMDGVLDPIQEQFLLDQATEAARNGQQLVLFSHHNGMKLDGLQQLELWNQVAARLQPLAGHTVLWYWGHVHAGAVYHPQPASRVSIAARCCGHGCVPWGSASNLANGAARGAVSWYENTVVGPGSNYFVTNGFATLTVDGGSLVERFYGSDASGSWTIHWQS